MKNQAYPIINTPSIFSFFKKKTAAWNLLFQNRREASIFCLGAWRFSRHAPLGSSDCILIFQHSCGKFIPSSLICIRNTGMNTAQTFLYDGRNISVRILHVNTEISIFLVDSDIISDPCLLHIFLGNHFYFRSGIIMHIDISVIKDDHKHDMAWYMFRPLQDREHLKIHMGRSLKYCCKICCWILHQIRVY